MPLSGKTASEGWSHLFHPAQTKSRHRVQHSSGLAFPFSSSLLCCSPFLGWDQKVLPYSSMSNAILPRSAFLLSISHGFHPFFMPCRPYHFFATWFTSLGIPKSRIRPAGQRDFLTEAWNISKALKENKKSKTSQQNNTNKSIRFLLLCFFWSAENESSLTILL